MTAPLLGEILSLAMFVAVFAVLMLGFPVAFSIGGTAVIFAALGSALGVFDWPLLAGMAGRIIDSLVNEVLVSV
ncbi:MAG: C4-dicarboxylate ABC transporter, partial [Alphaproteobacteria bacterium]|nr:C4-dicarboxylate ABC transporter [Alphaproteobacteria bacterium]